MICRYISQHTLSISVNDCAFTLRTFLAGNLAFWVAVKAFFLQDIVHVIQDDNRTIPNVHWFTLWDIRIHPDPEILFLYITYLLWWLRSCTFQRDKQPSNFSICTFDRVLVFLQWWSPKQDYKPDPGNTFQGKRLHHHFNHIISRFVLFDTVVITTSGF